MKNLNRNSETTLHASASMFIVAVVTASSMVACGGDFQPYENPAESSEAVARNDLDIEAGTPRSPADDVDDTASCDPTASCWCGTPAPDTDDLSCLESALLGQWTGTMGGSNDRPGTSVEITFLDEATYEARCPWFGDSGPGLCLEEDGVETARAYTIDAFGEEGVGSGRIETPDQASWSFITELRLSADGERLTFEVWSPWNGQEVRAKPFELRRVQSDVEDR